jgi:hypothetical protein
VSPERQWWLRVPAVLVRPRAVFVALRETAQDDLDARQEPVLALILLAGIGGVLATSTAATLADSREYDAALVAVWTFVAGGLYGMAGYFLIGGALYLGARGLGSLGDFRRARHVVAFAAVPLALSLLTLRPVELLLVGTRAVHGWTWVRSLGALGLVALLLAAFAYLPEVLPGG